MWIYDGVLGTWEAGTRTTGAPVDSLSLFVTETELATWRSRSTSGPYKTTGDLGRANSPGDWNRIVANKNAFVSNPGASRFGGPAAHGYTATGIVQPAWSWSGTPPMLGNNGPHEDLNCAAFFALVTGTQTVAAAVAAELVANINYQDTVFGNRSRWSVASPGSGETASHNFHMAISIWLGSRIVAFDYLEAYEVKHGVTLLTSGQKASFRQWCNDYGYFLEPHIHAYVGRSFVNRKADNYTLTASGSPPATWAADPTDTSGTMSHASAFYHNRIGYAAMGMTMAGVISADSFLIGEGKRFFKETIRFGHAPTWICDLHRDHDPRPSEGVKYSAMFVSEMATCAEMLRATGDLDLYSYATTLGSTAAGTASTTGQYNGQDRSLQTAIDLLLRLVSGELALYHGGVRFIPAPDWTAECEFAVAQRHFADSEWDSIYRRVGIAGFPASPNTAWSSPHAGTSGVFPAAHFCFIGMGA